jgi:hypothetical protein
MMNTCGFYNDKRYAFLIYRNNLSIANSRLKFGQSYNGKQMILFDLVKKEKLVHDTVINTSTPIYIPRHMMLNRLEGLE